MSGFEDIVSHIDAPRMTETMTIGERAGSTRHLWRSSMISTRKARKLRAYVLRKRAMKRELDEYLRQSYEAEAKSCKGWQE